MSKKRKIVLVGTGFVGMSTAYSFLSTGGIDESVLLDVTKERAVGEAMDLQHGLPYARGEMEIYTGDYADYRDASIVIITAEAAQKPEETRLDLTTKGAKIMKSIVESIMASGFDNILIIASNPVDGMTYLTQKVSSLPKERVIGSGVILDMARLRYMMSEYLDVSSSNMYAHIMREHGDSSFVPWTHAYVGSKSLLELLDEKGKPLSDLHDIYTNVQQTAYEIINRKRATFYGTGLSLNRLMYAALDSESAILTISAYQEGRCQQKGLYIGVPTVVNREGIREVIRLELNEVDRAKFDSSYRTLKKISRDIIDSLLWSRQFSTGDKETIAIFLSSFLW